MGDDECPEEMHAGRQDGMLTTRTHIVNEVEREKVEQKVADPKLERRPPVLCPHSRVDGAIEERGEREGDC